MVLPKNSLAVVLAIAAMLIVSACAAPEPQDPPAPGMNDQVPPGEPGADDPMAPPAPEPTTEEVSGAIVNGEEISSQEVVNIQQQFAQQGMQLSAEEALEQAVNERLLSQAAREEGITLTNDEVEAQINEILAEQGASIDEWRAEIEAQGLSYEEELDAVREDFVTQQYLDTVFAGVTFEATQEEVQELYDAQAAMSPEELPPLEEIEDQIVMMLEQEAQQEVLQEHIETLREEAEVVVE